MDTFIVPRSECPACGSLMDRASAVGHDCSPKPNDLTICVWCFAFLRFDDELTLATLPPEAFALLDRSTRRELERARQTLKDSVLR